MERKELVELLKKKVGKLALMTVIETYTGKELTSVYEDEIDDDNRTEKVIDILLEEVKDLDTIKEQISNFNISSPMEFEIFYDEQEENKKHIQKIYQWSGIEFHTGIGYARLIGYEFEIDFKTKRVSLEMFFYKNNKKHIIEKTTDKIDNKDDEDIMTTDEILDIFKSVYNSL